MPKAASKSILVQVSGTTQRQQALLMHRLWQQDHSLNMPPAQEMNVDASLFESAMP